MLGWDLKPYIPYRSTSTPFTLPLLPLLPPRTASITRKGLTATTANQVSLVMPPRAPPLPAARAPAPTLKPLAGELRPPRAAEARPGQVQGSVVLANIFP